MSVDYSNLRKAIEDALVGAVGKRVTQKTYNETKRQVEAVLHSYLGNLDPIKITVSGDPESRSIRLDPDNDFTRNLFKRLKADAFMVA